MDDRTLSHHLKPASKGGTNEQMKYRKTFFLIVFFCFNNFNVFAKKRHGLKHFENFKPLTTAGLFRFQSHNRLHTSCRPPLHSIIITRGSITNQCLRLVTVKTNISLRLQESNGNFTLSTEKEEDKIRWHLNLFLNLSQRCEIQTSCHSACRHTNADKPLRLNASRSFFLQKFLN